MRDGQHRLGDSWPSYCHTITMTVEEFLAKYEPAE